MKKNSVFENIIIITFFLVVLAYPFVAMIMGVQNNLSGAEEKINIDLKNIREVDSDLLDKYIVQNFPGREFLVRTKNQFLYSFFDISPNKSITKVDDTLISTETLNYYYHGLHRASIKEIDDVIMKLRRVNDICKEKGKKLLVVTTPTKPRYYKGKLPFADDIILAYQGERESLSYDLFKKKLKSTGIYYFDSIDYIDSHKDIFYDEEIPLFYNVSHHWSNYKGNLVGLGIVKYIKDNLKVKMPDMRVTAVATSSAVFPDRDLFDVLNIYDDPHTQFFKPVVKYTDYENDDLNFTIQGGSFLGGLLFPNSTISVNGSVLHIENKAAIYDHYKEHLMFDDYDDLNSKYPLLKHLKKTDILILEINELNIYNATFGFADYIIEHEKDI